MVRAFDSPAALNYIQLTTCNYTLSDLQLASYTLTFHLRTSSSTSDNVPFFRLVDMLQRASWNVKLEWFRITITHGMISMRDVGLSLSSHYVKHRIVQLYSLNFIFSITGSSPPHAWTLNQSLDSLLQDIELMWHFSRCHVISSKFNNDPITKEAWSHLKHDTSYQLYLHLQLTIQCRRTIHSVSYPFKWIFFPMD